MTTIADISIATGPDASITPLELLEEFADSTPTWSFLEEDTYHYRETRGCPSCVLSHVTYEPFGTVDYAFATASRDEEGAVRLVLIDVDRREASSPEGASAVEQRDRTAREFLTAFQAYAAAANVPVKVETSEREVDSSAALSGI